jgi:hypothetical protein
LDLVDGPHLTFFFFTVVYLANLLSDLRLFRLFVYPPFNKKKGSRLPEDLESHPSIQCHFIRELPRVPESMPKIVYYLYAPIKAFILSWQLFLLTMFTVAAPEVYIVQVSTKSRN